MARKVVASITPSTLTISAQLYVKVPLAGRVNITGISGSLITGATAKFNVFVASGSITLTAKKNANNKHDLYVSYSLKVSLVGTIQGSDYKLITLP